MRIQHIKSWIQVLSIFFLVVLACIAWERFTSGPIKPAAAQQVNDPTPALEQVSPSVVSIWGITHSGLETHINVLGCALIIDSRGLALTSATLMSNIESLYVVDDKDIKYPVRVIAFDKKIQLTLLKTLPCTNLI